MWKPKEFKIDKLNDLFLEVGDWLYLKELLNNLNVNYKTLKTYCWLLRNKEKTRPDRLMDLRIHDGIVERIG